MKNKLWTYGFVIAVAFGSAVAFAGTGNGGCSDCTPEPGGVHVQRQCLL